MSDIRVLGAKMATKFIGPRDLGVEANQVRHIGVGHRGHTFFERSPIGSVARQVIAHRTCAATVVRPPVER